MSGHLIGCTKPLELPTSHKLALVAFADSADDRTHIGFPGYEGVQEWANVSRGRAAELIRDLVEMGYLRQHKRGHRGQRAEYIVFPDGCCDLHRTPAAEPDVDLEAIARAAGVSVDQARIMLAAMAGADSGGNASGAPDALSGNESDAPDPIDTGATEPASEAVDNPGKGPERVHGSRSNANAFTPSNTPQPPPASRQGSCAAHPNGHARCRDCGTSPRAAAKAANRAKAAEQRAADQARVAASHQAAAAAAADRAAGARRIRDARAAAKAAVSASRGATR